MIVVYETDIEDHLSEALPFWVNPATHKEFRIRHAQYMAVLRFILIEPAQRGFTVERFCFRGSVDDWISLGTSGPLPVLIKKFIKHLGNESIYDLY